MRYIGVIYSLRVQGEQRATVCGTGIRRATLTPHDRDSSYVYSRYLSGGVSFYFDILAKG